MMSSEALQNQTLLSAQLSVRYAGKPAVLRDVRLEIQRGEVLGLVGQSGSGKSTLALAILGLLDKKAQVEGTIRLQESDLAAAFRTRTALAARTHRCAGIAESAVLSESCAQDPNPAQGSMAGACVGHDRGLCERDPRFPAERFPAH